MFNIRFFYYTGTAIFIIVYDMIVYVIPAMLVNICNSPYRLQY